MKSWSKNRIDMLDGLRAMAVILVMARHSIRRFWPDRTAEFMPVGPVDLGAFFINGWVGVELFFILSGFLITRQLLKPSMTTREYFKRRFFRIAPAYYFVLIIACLGVFPFYPHVKDHDNLLGSFIYHLFFLQDYWTPDIVVVFWTLAVEIKFYLLAPFLIWMILKIARVRWRVLALILLWASQPLLRWIIIRYFIPEFDDFDTYFYNIRIYFHLSIGGMLVGMLCAFLMRDESFKKFARRPLAANTLFFTGAVIFLTLMFSGPLVDNGVSFFDKVFLSQVISAGFGLMLLGLLSGAMAVPLFSGRVFTFIALISYSLYLVHLPLMYFSESVMRHFFNIGAMPGPLAWLSSLPLFLMLSIGAATLMYKYIEYPAIMWSRRHSGQEQRGQPQKREEPDHIRDGRQENG